MLSPKRTKFRKAHKGRIHGNAKGGTTLNFGGFGLKALDLYKSKVDFEKLFSTFKISTKANRSLIFCPHSKNPKN